jgi:hypothetical protein
MRLNHHSGSLKQSFFTGLFISSAIALIALLPIHQHRVLGVVLQMGVLTVPCQLRAPQHLASVQGSSNK